MAEPSSHRRRGLVALAPLLLLVSGCGSDAPSPGATSTTTATGTGSTGAASTTSFPAPVAAGKVADGCRPVVRLATSKPQERAAPATSAATSRSRKVSVTTNCGDLTLTLDGAKAPKAAASFVHLAQTGFFDRTLCHRLTTSGIYVLQCGDPTGTGTGGPGYDFGPVENAPKDQTYPAGTLAMARRGDDANSNGSQFFIVYRTSVIPADSAGGYTVFGKVINGMDIVRKIAQGGLASNATAPADSISLEKVTVQ